MEVLEIERAIVDLRRAVESAAVADSRERQTASDYQMMIGHMESMLIEIEAPQPDIEALSALSNEVNRIFRVIAHRITEQMLAAARSISAGELASDLFVGTAEGKERLVAARAIIEELSQKFVSAANRRAAEISAAAQIPQTVEVDSPSHTEDHAPMSTPTQSEIDLKIENMQLRMDGRLSSIEGKMDALAAQVSGSERAMALLAERAVAAAESAGNLKQTLWITSITTILSVLGIALAAYFGTQASNLSIVSSTISAFEAGRAAGTPAPPTSPEPEPPAK